MVKKLSEEQKRLELIKVFQEIKADLQKKRLEKEIQTGLDNIKNLNTTDENKDFTRELLHDFKNRTLKKSKK